MVKVVPPLEPLSLRPISPRFLSEEERIRIADLASSRAEPTEIAKTLRRSPSTISRELRRNTHESGQCRPIPAHSIAPTRRRRPKLSTDPALCTYVKARSNERWSPQQISRALRVAHPGDVGMRVATESIYLAIYRPGSGLLRKPDS